MTPLSFFYFSEFLVLNDPFPQSLQIQKRVSMKVRTSPYLVLFILIACDGMPAPPCPPEAPLVSDFALPNGRQCTLCSDETKTRGDDCLAKCRCEDDDCNERVCSYQPPDCGVVVCDPSAAASADPFPLEPGCEEVCPDEEPEMFSKCDSEVVGSCNCPTSDPHCAFNCLGGEWVMVCGGGGMGMAAQEL